jgi:hypothetical protein
MTARYSHSYGIDHDDFLRMVARQGWVAVQSGALVLRICRPPGVDALIPLYVLDASPNYEDFRAADYEIGAYSRIEQWFNTDLVPPENLKELATGRLVPVCECCEASL